MIEVEAKFLVVDEEALANSIRQHFPQASEEVSLQTDEYFNHPCRDFGVTDEALRIRNCSGRVELTYKGPRLDQFTKTREELELEIQNVSSPETDETLRAMLLALGFRAVGFVRKYRCSYSTMVEGRSLTLSLDRVDGLPLYAELEITCDSSERDAATVMILGMAERLGLRNSERRSYLELLRYC